MRRPVATTALAHPVLRSWMSTSTLYSSKTKFPKKKAGALLTDALLPYEVTRECT
ncbi:hypothetical protein [Metabacillus halosaccharovorans]|uniref:hypothetical protein n=1 Tax=Metabacillus halosaccharovorans TaxID=930124 RepID=UPI0020421138|nr:hypothetical protein [Metabacillus halosaccharovorans]MCM3441596.1 hypothetical protein [Metabacillus halosaccharovorans]